MLGIGARLWTRLARGPLARLNAARGALDAGLPRARVEVPPWMGGGAVDLERSPSGAITARGSPQSGGVVAFLPSNSPPDDYDRDLPFVPGVGASIHRMGSAGRRVRWHRHRVADEVLRTVRVDLERTGWQEVRARPVVFGLLGREWTYRRGASERFLTLRRIPSRRPQVLLRTNDCP